VACGRTLLVLVFLLATLAVAGSPSATPRSGSRAGSLILFWSDTPYPSLWTIRPDGTHRHRIRLRRACKRPSLSPDRKWIVFDGMRRGADLLTEFDIQIVRRDGTGRRVLTSTADWEVDPQWSPDGTPISFTRRPPHGDWRYASIWTMRPDGSDQRLLTPGNKARWSPDGRRLVFSAPAAGSDGDLFIIDADGTNLRHLVVTPAVEWPSGWSPDGKRILFTRSFNDRAADVYVINADGTNERRLTRARGIESGGSWSPDGSRIVFSGDRYRRFHLFVMQADGSRRHELTVGQADDYDPSWR
jgi:TolB protein